MCIFHVDVGKVLVFCKLRFIKKKVSIKYNIAVAVWDCEISNISYTSS